MSGLTRRKQTDLNVSKTAFGELSVANLVPTIQYLEPYNTFNPQVVESFTNGGATDISSGDGLVNMYIDTGVGDYATLMSIRNSRYRAGQGNLARYTCDFNTGINGSLQLAGFGTAYNGFFFGYNGSRFGIMHRYNGAPEIYKIVVSTAFTGTGTLVITLNDVEFNCPVITSGGSLSFSAHQIEAGVAYTGWDIEHINDTIYFIYKGDGNKTGTFSIDWDNANTGGNGTMSKVSDGVDATEDWIYQENWNIDNMDGTGKSRMTLNQQKLNVYQIKYQYLGAGNISFFIEDDNTGEFILVHQLEYANLNDIPSLSNPKLRMLYAIASISSATPMTLAFSSFGAFNEGIVNKNLGPVYSVTNSRTAITLNTETNVIVLHNGLVLNEILNHSTLVIKYLSIAVDGTKNATIKIYKNGTIGNNTSANYTNYQLVDGNNTSATYDTTSDTITNGTLLYTFVLGKAEGRTFDMTTQDLELLRGEHLTITCTSTASTDCYVSINFNED